MHESSSQPLLSAEPDLTGRHLGDYRLLRRLGRGGMAVVYLARQESLQRQVAVKVLRAQLALDATYVQRFRNEAQAAAALVHANIVQIYEVGQVDGIHFIAQEYVAGSSLKQYFSRDGALTGADALLVMCQVASALHKASQIGIVHRDIKPENILINADGEVKVADFGLARAANRLPDAHLTDTGVTMGTPVYMSPEQIEGRPLDIRSDIYSFGVTSFHMLAGRPPFEGDTPMNVAIQHLQTQPPSLAELRPDLPEPLCRIIHRMLNKTPQDRFQDASELAAALRGLSSDARLTPDASRPSRAILPSAANRPARTARNPLAATEALQQLMAAPTATGRFAWLRSRGWILGMGVAFLIGGFAARAGRSVDPLSPGIRGNSTPVPRMATVEEQFRHAESIDSLEGWRSVSEYFAPESDPTKRHQHLYYQHESQLHLAVLYLEQGNLPEAEATFRELIQLDAVDDLGYRTFGMAGLMIIHRQEGRNQPYAEAREHLTKQYHAADSNTRRRIQQMVEDYGVNIPPLPEEDAARKASPKP